MAAGINDHYWSVTELLQFRVLIPAWGLPSIVVGARQPKNFLLQGGHDCRILWSYRLGRRNSFLLEFWDVPLSSLMADFFQAI